LISFTGSQSSSNIVYKLIEFVSSVYHNTLNPEDLKTSLTVKGNSLIGKRVVMFDGVSHDTKISDSNLNFYFNRRGKKTAPNGEKYDLNVNFVFFGDGVPHIAAKYNDDHYHIELQDIEDNKFDGRITKNLQGQAITLALQAASRIYNSVVGDIIKPNKVALTLPSITTSSASKVKAQKILSSNVNEFVDRRVKVDIGNTNVCQFLPDIVRNFQIFLLDKNYDSKVVDSIDNDSLSNYLVGVTKLKDVTKKQARSRVLKRREQLYHGMMSYETDIQE